MTCWRAVKQIINGYVISLSPDQIRGPACLGNPFSRGFGSSSAKGGQRSNPWLPMASPRGESDDDDKPTSTNLTESTIGEE